MRLIRLFKNYIIKSIENTTTHVLFLYGGYGKSYDTNTSIKIFNYKRSKPHTCNEYTYYNNTHIYKKYIHDMLIYDFYFNKLSSIEHYLVNKCLIKCIVKYNHRHIYYDYHYEKTENYNYNFNVKNSIINKILSSRLFQFIRYIINKN